MNIYARGGHYKPCEKIILETKELGMVADTAMYTTLINAYYKVKIIIIKKN